MATFGTDALVELIKTLTKAEKRSFRLFVTRNQNSEDILFVKIFEEIVRVGDFNEEQILEKIPGVKKRQLSNLKAHLFKQILLCLRMLSKNKKSEIAIREWSDYAQILYEKGLYRQCLDMLRKAKKKALENYQYIQALQIVNFEMHIESQYITRSIENRAEEIKKELNELTTKIQQIQQFANLSLQLYAWYLKKGYVSHPEEANRLKTYYADHIEPHTHQQDNRGFYERLYLYQTQAWYYYILQDFVNYYRYCRKWVDLFDQEPNQLRFETPVYLKGVHNMLNALFMALRGDKYLETLPELKRIADSELLSTRNNQGLFELYKCIHFFNEHFIQGTFSKGVDALAPILQVIQQNPYNWDSHRIMVFYYKIACLYFGSGDWDNSITFLNKIIQPKTQNFRTDIQCFARILNLISHYELGNQKLLEYQIKSVYRYLAKMEELQKVQREIFRFLRKSSRIFSWQVQDEFKDLKAKLEILQNDPYESRAFLYLDIISWLESKIEDLPVEDVIRQKFLDRNVVNIGK